VGASIARLDGWPKVLGTERYGADGAPADALWLRVVRSPHASARFTLGDVEAARARTTARKLQEIRYAVQLEREADRLAALLDAARAASRASGVPVIWRPTEQGFAFDGLPPKTLPETWLAPDLTQVSAEPVVLGPEPIMQAQWVRLSAASGSEAPLRTVTLASDGLRPFVVMNGSAP
jgi:hypothetical protein